MYAPAEEVEFDQQLWHASKVVFQDTSSLDRETLFFLCADGKAQILIANCKNWKAKTGKAMVCWVCGCNRAQCFANFGLKDTINGLWDVVLPIEVIYQRIAADGSIADYGLHEVLCVTICGISGMRETVAAAMGKSAAVVARNLFEPILDVARI